MSRNRMLLERAIPSRSFACQDGRIPDYILKDAKLVVQLPVFFRTISGQKPSSEDREKLLALIHRGD